MNGQGVKKRTHLSVGDEVEVTFALTPEIELVAEEIPLNILFEDESMLAIDKPCGLVVHPGAGNWTGTLVNGLLHHCQGLPSDGLRPGIVHRLDKDTSGVILAAKTESARKALMEQFAAREVEKEYLAICCGNPGNRTIDQPLGRHPGDRKRQAVRQGGREAITQVEVLEFDGRSSRVRLRPKTGRTHQLRVHLQALGTPVVGDPLYGGRPAERMMLHAHRIHVRHPISGEPMTFEAPLPF